MSVSYEPIAYAPNAEAAAALVGEVQKQSEFEGLGLVQSPMNIAGNDVVAVKVEGRCPAPLRENLKWFAKGIAAGAAGVAENVTATE